MSISCASRLSTMARPTVWGMGALRAFVVRRYSRTPGQTKTTDKRKRPAGAPPAVSYRLAPGRARHRISRLASREHAGQLADRLLVLLVLDLGEITRDLQQHPLMRRGRARRFLAEAFVEIRDRRIEHAGDLVEPAGRHAVDAALVLVGLLISDADHLGELLLGQAQHDTPFADAPADVIVDRSGRPPSLGFCHDTPPLSVLPDALGGAIGRFRYYPSTPKSCWNSHALNVVANSVKINASVNMSGRISPTANSVAGNPHFEEVSGKEFRGCWRICGGMVTIDLGFDQDISKLLLPSVTRR